MIVQVLQMVTDALTGSYGVNTQLSTLPVGTGSTVPPTILTIVDETRSDEVAVGRYPTTLPALVVTVEGTTTFQGDVVSGVRDGEVTVLVRYVTQDTDSAASVRDVHNTFRAVNRTLKEFNSNTRAADRTREDIHIIECLSVEQTTTFHQIDDSTNTGAIRAKFKVRDVTP